MHIKKFAFLFLAVSLSFLCFAGCNYTSETEMEYYCSAINEQIKDLDFFTAEVSGGMILLFDRDDTLITEIPLEKYDKDKKILEIRKNSSIIYFILGGSVDDAYGIMFVNDDSDWIMKGISSLERIGGYYYKFDTAQ